MLAPQPHCGNDHPVTGRHLPCTGLGMSAIRWDAAIRDDSGELRLDPGSTSIRDADTVEEYEG